MRGVAYRKQSGGGFSRLACIIEKPSQVIAMGLPTAGAREADILNVSNPRMIWWISSLLFPSPWAVLERAPIRLWVSLQLRSGREASGDPYPAFAVMVCARHVTKRTSRMNWSPDVATWPPSLTAMILLPELD